MKRMSALVIGLLALSSTACDSDLTDEAGIETPAEGAYVVTWNPLATQGKQCNVGAHSGAVGWVKDTEITRVERNGRNDTSIECAVEPSGDGFRLFANIVRLEESLRLEPVTITADATAMDPVLTDVTYRSEATGGVFTGADCQVYLLDAPQEVSAGNAWFQFQCAVVAKADDDQSCAIAASTVLLRNCVGAP